MRRTPFYFVLACLELVRYFVLVLAAGNFVTTIPSTSQVLRIISAPNALFAIALLFLGIDSVRYEVYKPLLVVGKLAALFSGIIAIPRLLAPTASTSAFVAYSILGIAVWDAVTAAMLAFTGKRGREQPALSSPEPERVELD